MSDEIETEGESVPPLPPVLPTQPCVGNRLRDARQARSMSVADVAQFLKLGVRQVEALEKGDWHSLPGATFIRGFVRNYARLVQLDTVSLMTQLDQVLDTPSPQLSLPPPARPAPMPSGAEGRRHDYAVMLLGLGLVGVAVLIYYLMPGGFADLEARMRPIIALWNSPQVPAPPVVPEPLFPPGASPQDVLTPQAVAPPAKPETPAPASPPPASSSPPSPPGTAPASAATPLLRLNFDDESWVEIRDREGKVLLSKRGLPGEDLAVNNVGPVSLIVGYAPGVHLLLRGQAIDLTPHTRGNVARLTLD